MFSEQKIEKRVLSFTSSHTWAKYSSIFCARYLLFVEFFWLLIAIWRRLDWQLLVGLLVTMVLTELVTDVLQQTIRRDRPYQNGHHSLIKPWIKTPSFPSGHASLSWAMAIFAFTISPEIGVVALVMALLVTGSRVAVGVHYLSDILIGTVLGALLGLFVIFANLGDFVFNLIS
ncbi:MAG: phosphatase PAP2 family protein [Candidatus Uhrbacteria bacterium]|nr:phosphatase PAP2 family protein [Patescibacteria group bacterium]MBU1906682.1 phosphatase PAP2 family protein [Patescibacteria group bacterium]